MHEQLDLANGSPIKVKWCDYDCFKFPWHFHAEYEIVYIINGTGTRFTGNNIEPFNNEDLVLYGTFLPHMHKSDEKYYQGNTEHRVHAIIIQFKEDFFNHAFTFYPEFRRIKELLEMAKYGISFDKKGNQEIREKIKLLLEKKGIDRLLECINILYLMSKSQNKYTLANEDVDHRPLIESDERMVKVLGRLHQTYDQEIVLEDIAEFSGMNPAAFCRYFKNKTGKSMTRYVNELRIAFACKLLLEGRMTITQICYETGFNNLSNFNRQFKSITNYTPSNYLLEFKKEYSNN